MTDIFNIDGLKAIKIYPKLSFVEKADTTILSGELDLHNDRGEIEDTYSIEIHRSLLYPYRFPYLYETGGRIPINIEWHRFEPGGECCICVPPKEILVCKAGITLIEFISEHAIPYFFNQTFRYKNGYFLNESRHGLLGLIDFYFEKLNISNIYNLIDILNFVIKGKEPNRVDWCFCGRHVKYRKCHRDAYRFLKKIGTAQLSSDLSAIKQVIVNIKN